LRDSFRAVYRARLPILIAAFAYVVSISVGAFMVHEGNSFALNYRDKLVGDAAQHDPAAIANIQGNNIRAALLDFTGNLVMGAIPKTVAGGSIVLSYPLVLYQGWIGGIVSVRGDHTSRLNSPRPAFYYLLTLILQIVPYSLAVGAGVNAGIALIRPAVYYRGDKWLRIFPKESIRDVVRIYMFVVPLFLVASFWEFLSTWNF
jgi:uncharacterized membrane protein SpoIIM required for sporulation